MERKQSLTERWNRRLGAADSEYRSRTGRVLTEAKKMMTAAVLENTAKFMNFRASGNRVTEALDNSIGVQTADIGRI